MSNFNLSDIVESLKYDLLIWQPGIPDSGQVFLRVKLPRTVIFSVDFAGSYAADALNSATSNYVISVQKNGSQFGTITYASASATPTFSAASETTFQAGDILGVIAPGSQDATLQGISITLVGRR